MLLMVQQCKCILMHLIDSLAPKAFDTPATISFGDAPGLSTGDQMPPSTRRRGYHPPRPPRRPERYARLQASKSKGGTPTSAQEDPLAAQASQVRQISSALQLPFQSKSTCKRSRDSLVELDYVTRPIKAIGASKDLLWP